MRDNAGKTIMAGLPIKELLAQHVVKKITTNRMGRSVGKTTYRRATDKRIGTAMRSNVE
jgi:hypothetical protein